VETRLRINSQELRPWIVEKVKIHLEPWKMREGRQPARTRTTEHGSWEIHVVGSRYQATIGEDATGWEGLLHAVVNCREREIAKTLLLRVVMTCKSPISSVTNPNTVSSNLKHMTIVLGDCKSIQSYIFWTSSIFLILTRNHVSETGLLPEIGNNSIDLAQK
jgi:hypothetical protein